MQVCKYNNVIYILLTYVATYIILKTKCVHMIHHLVYYVALKRDKHTNNNKLITLQCLYYPYKLSYKEKLNVM